PCRAAARVVRRERHRYAAAMSRAGPLASGTDGSDTLAARLDHHAARFEERFGRGAGVRRFFAPGRVNLMGAHLDYNGGPVMPTALDRGTFIALRPRADGQLCLSSTLETETMVASIHALPVVSTGRWFDYPLGVIVHLLKTRRVRHGVDVLFGGNL